MANLKQFQDTDNNDNCSSAEIISALEQSMLSIPEVPTFVEDTARRLGVSERTVRHELQIAPCIPCESRAVDSRLHRRTGGEIISPPVNIPTRARLLGVKLEG